MPDQRKTARRGQTEVFRHNVSRLVSNWLRDHGGTVKTLASEIFPVLMPTFETRSDGTWIVSEKTYRWLRKAMATGFPPKKVGATNRDELEQLHRFFGVRYGDLWRPECESAVERLAALLPKLTAGQVAEIHDQIDVWRHQADYVQSARWIFEDFARNHPDRWERFREKGEDADKMVTTIMVYLARGFVHDEIMGGMLRVTEPSKVDAEPAAPDHFSPL